ncbi:DUF4422 domain-containing protein [Megamonas hypermegale]|uniref:DUF4422 domain-containing protein n=1 Tax=Megamonas hypermegale TaxID=158847 RepID=UPI0026E97270|nr:DUF4422 domain-containing protein [Megamonas hypermegale]
MEKKKDIKIFVSHRIDLDSETIDNPLFVPVRCGAVFDKRENITMLGDNTGDNISEKRMSFCELTVQYWAWKNVEADYYGLCHYRRYLSFSNEKYKTEYIKEPINNVICHNEILEKFLDKKAIQKYGLLDESNMIKCIESNDVLVSEWCNIKKMIHSKGKVDSVEDYWFKYENFILASESINNLKKIIQEKYPNMIKYVDKYLKGDKYLGYNCFIMKKEIFYRYCNFIFDVLFDFEKTLKNKNIFNKNMMRTCAFISELLYGIYIYYLEEKKIYKIKHLQLVFFANTDKEKILYPIKKKNNIPVILMSSNYFAPYLGVFIQSLINTSSKNNYYDIIVFEREISQRNKSLLEEIVENYSNIKLRFYNPQKKINDVKLYIAAANFAYEAYYRIFSPWILLNYDKAIVMDCDIVLNRDIADLYQFNIDNYLAAAVKDIIYQGFLNSLDRSNWINYSKEKLGLSEPYNYINTGVLLLNLKKIRERYSFEYVIDFAKNAKFRYQEQDIFNVLLNNSVLFLDRTWNFGVESNLPTKYCHELAPAQSYEEYLETKKNPSIIHYLAKPKPWDDPNVEFADKFWKIARQTSFYEIILARLATDYTNMSIYGHDMFYHNGFLSKSKKQRIKNFIKIFLPKGTKRHRFVKKAYFKLRGWPFVE